MENTRGALLTSGRAVRLALATLLAACALALAAVLPQAAWAEDNVAKIGETKYETLGEAVAAVPTDGTRTTIEFLGSAQGGGVKVESGQNIVFDLKGFTYTVGEPTVGSTGTETNGFQLLKGSTVKFQNGTVKASNYNRLAKLIQNYCDLTLDNVTLDARDNSICGYVVSNNHGNVFITGNTNIYAAENQCAFDVYYWPQNGYGDGVSVTVDTTGTISGKVEYGSDGTDAGKAGIAEKATLDIKQGTIQGELITYDLGVADKAGITVTGGTLSNDKGSFDKYIPDGHAAANVNGKKTVGIATTQTDEHVAVVDGQYFKSLQNAINAANGGTVTLVKDAIESAAEDVTIPADAAATLDLAGYTLANKEDHTIINNGTLTIVDSVGGGTVDSVTHAKAAVYNNGTLTIKGGIFTRSAETPCTKDASVTNSWYTIMNLGTIEEISGGTFRTGDGTAAKLGNHSSIICNGNGTTGGTIKKISGGSFTSAANVIKNESGSIIGSITGGTFTMDNTSNLWNGGNNILQNYGTIESITGGEFKALGSGQGFSYGTQYKRNGIAGAGTIKELGGNVTLSMSGDNNRGILVSAGGSLAITGGTYSVSDDNGASADAASQLIAVKKDATLIVSDGDFSEPVNVAYLDKSLKAELYSTKKNADAPYSYYRAVDDAIRDALLTGGTVKLLNVDEKTDTVSVTLKDGDKKTTVQVKKGESLTLPTLEDKSLCVQFAGWGADKVTEIKPTEDVTLEAQWGDPKHAFEWKCDADVHWQECSKCGETTDKGAHTFKWVIDKEATATEPGSKHEECTACGYPKESVEIPATGNGSGEGTDDDPTGANTNTNTTDEPAKPAALAKTGDAVPATALAAAGVAAAAAIACGFAAFRKGRKSE